MTSARGDAKASSSSPPITMPPTTRGGSPRLDLVAAHHREHRRSAQQQLAARRACQVSRRGVVGRMHAGDGHGLRVEVAARRRAWWRGSANAARCATSTRRPRCAARSPASVPSAMRCVSPVGSRSSRGLTTLPAGVPSIDSVSLIASRRPSGVNCAGVTPGDSGSGARTPRCPPRSSRPRIAVLHLVEELAAHASIWPPRATRRRAARRCRLRCRA
jgi:hypothetical protein